MLPWWRVSVGQCWYHYCDRVDSPIVGRYVYPEYILAYRRIATQPEPEPEPEPGPS